MTTTEVETITLGDVPREQIERITWVGFSSKPYFITQPAEIDGFIYRMKAEPVQLLDGHWHSVESRFPYRCFTVFLKR